MAYTLIMGGIILGQILLIALFFFIFYSTWKKDSLLRRTTQNLLLLIFSITLLLTSLELGFKYFFIQSDGINFTLASINWYEKYWHPMNSLGYRDEEWTNNRVKGKKSIAVVGDSFVAGGGIEQVKNRFSNQLSQFLGDEYVVFNIARNGWGTQQELEGLQTYPYKPDVVIFSYYLNDIEPIAQKFNIPRPENLLIYPPTWLKPLVSNSYLFNFIYWRLFRWQAFADPNQRTEIQTYQAYLRDLYLNQQIWDAHVEELKAIYTYTQNKNQTLIVVVFPDMLKVAETGVLTAKVIDLFNTLNIPVIDVGALIKANPSTPLIVNSVDSHPSVEVNTLVAEALIDLFNQLNQP